MTSPPEEQDTGTPVEAIEVARFVTAMTPRLGAMAKGARLKLLAYFLSMARAEAELLVHGSAEREGVEAESDQPGPVEPNSDSGNSSE